jgi:hypothetical protein
MTPPHLTSPPQGGEEFKVVEQPLNPPLRKGEDSVPPFKKGGKGGFFIHKKALFPSIGKRAFYVPNKLPSRGSTEWGVKVD